MSDQPPAMTRSLFGVRRSAVNQMISDRDVMLRQAEGRVRAAEAKVARLESDIATLQEANARLQQELEGSRGGDAGQGATALSPDITTRFLNEELGTILSAAEESATRIVERARASTQQQVAEADRVWREAQGQISKFAAWRDQVDPVLRGAQAKIDDVRARIEEVPDQIREALAPLAESVASLDGDLAEVTGAASPPVLEAPTEEAAKAIEAQAATGEAAIDEAAAGDTSEGPEDVAAPPEEVDESSDAEAGQGSDEAGGGELPDGSEAADAEAGLAAPER